MGVAGRDWGLTVQGLGGLLPVPVVPETPSEEPWFNARMAAGGLARATLGFGPAHATLGAGRLGDANLLEFEVELELDLDSLTLLIVPRGQALLTDTDHYVGAGVQAGVRFGL